MLKKLENDVCKKSAIKLEWKLLKGRTINVSLKKILCFKKEKKLLRFKL